MLLDFAQLYTNANILSMFSRLGDLNEIFM
jgi:hypothetical protein